MACTKYFDPRDFVFGHREEEKQATGGRWWKKGIKFLKFRYRHWQTKRHHYWRGRFR